jgi:hypothetical protein
VNGCATPKFGTIAANGLGRFKPQKRIGKKRKSRLASYISMGRSCANIVSQGKQEQIK